MRRRRHIVRTIQLVLAIISFPLITLYCWYSTGFNLTEIQLSYFGIDNHVQWYWNLLMISLSIFMWSNINFYIDDCTRIKNIKLWKLAFAFPLFNLAIIGMAPMNYWYIHLPVAFVYFFSYPFIIFTFGFLERKRLKYKESLGHMLIALVMIIIPLSTYNMWPGKAITEIIHSMIVIYWNVYIYKKYIE